MNSAIPDSCWCKITGSKVTLKDRGTKARIYIELGPGKHRKIQVDGCIDIRPMKCDWSLLLENDKRSEYAFFELKGSDFCHAAKQLGNTITWFKENIGDPFLLHSSHVVISGRSLPKTNSSKTREKVRFREKFQRVLQEHKSGSTIKMP